MSKYPISKEFWPFSSFAPPIRNPQMAGWMGSKMKTPGWIWRDSELSVRKEVIPGCRGGPIEVFVMEPRNVETENCLVYYHGGGFFFEGAGYHYKLSREYALKTPCKVLFVRYRLAPKFPFPYPTEDSFEALKWALENAENLNINREKIAVGGDSAGGALAAAVSQMARDRLGIKLLFQLLVYPFTDRSLDTESNRRFTDTPMWNSTLSRKMVVGYLPDAPAESLAYASPIEAKSFVDLPDAYIETAEFDCLHDDGINYGAKLREAGAAVELNQTKGTMHGFDIVWKAPTTQAAIAARIQYMREKFL